MLQNRRRLQALMSTARVANVPSVVSNVMLGVVTAGISGSAPDLAWGKMAAAILSGSLLYIGGNFFNDWMDAAWDARHRPERALPAGVFRRRTYGASALWLGLAGLWAGTLAGPAAGLAAGWIALGVIAYTVLHKRTAWAVIFMGLCRGLLVWLGAAALAPDAPQWSPGVALASVAVMVYIIALSLAARRESIRDAGQPHDVSWVDGLFLLVPAVMLVNPALRGGGSMILSGALPYGLWMVFCLRVRRHGVGTFVSALLAGIPLVDWILLLPVGVFHLADGSPGGVGASWIVPPLAFAAALALQRLAPAT